MTQPLGLVEVLGTGGSAERPSSAYRAVTLGDARDDWAVYNRQGDLVYRGDARTAALVASRLTPAA